MMSIFGIVFLTILLYSSTSLMIGLYEDDFSFLDVRTWNIWIKTLKVPIYFMDGDAFEEAGEWLESIKETGGYGSLNWLEHGELVDRVDYVAGAGIQKISEITLQLWRT